MTAAALVLSAAGGCTEGGVGLTAPTPQQAPSSSGAGAGPPPGSATQQRSPGGRPSDTPPSATGPSATGPSAAGPSAAAPAAPWTANGARLTAALQTMARGRPDLAVAVRDNRTGRIFSFRGRTRFETASVVKLDILAALLLQAQDRDRSLTSDERRLARRMITESDNAATGTLYRRIGGVPGLERANRRLGLDRTVPSWSWGLTRTTVEDQVVLLSELRDRRGPLSSGSRGYATSLLRSVVAGQRWGVSAAARPGEEVALKNGWLPRSNEGQRWVVNSVGRLTGTEVDVSVAVLSHGNQSHASGIALVERAAKATRAHLRW